MGTIRWSFSDRKRKNSASSLLILFHIDGFSGWGSFFFVLSGTCYFWTIQFRASSDHYWSWFAVWHAVYRDLVAFYLCFWNFWQYDRKYNFLALIMGGVYALQKTSFGVTFTVWLAKTNNVLLIMGAVLVLLIGTLISLKIATIIYGRTFID